MHRVDVLLERATRILLSTTLPLAEADDEVAMDFLAERDDFMALLEESATFIVERSFRGPGDLDFEQAMVNLMDAVQQYLKASLFSHTSATPGRGPTTATA